MNVIFIYFNNSYPNIFNNLLHEYSGKTILEILADAIAQKER